MRTLQLTLTIAFISLIGSSVIAQDVHFSQFYKNPLLTNPGAAGMGKGFNRANLNYRSQWTTLDNSFSTMGMSVDLPMLFNKLVQRNSYLGAGIHIVNDVAGDAKLKTLNFGFSLTGILIASKADKISLGIQTNYVQRSVQPEFIQWDSQWNGNEYDPSIAHGENYFAQSKSHFDFSTGMLWKHKRHVMSVSAFDEVSFNVGAAYHHILRPNLEFTSFYTDKQYSKFVIHGDGNFHINGSYIAIDPAFYFAHQGPDNDFMVGGIVKYFFNTDTKATGFVLEKALGIGMYYRVNDAIIPSIVFEMAGFELQASYDYTVSTLQQAISGVGGFELSLRWQDTDGTLFNQGNKHVIFLD